LYDSLALSRKDFVAKEDAANFESCHYELTDGENDIVL